MIIALTSGRQSSLGTKSVNGTVNVEDAFLAELSGA